MRRNEREELALARALAALATAPIPHVDVVARVRAAVTALEATDRRLVRPFELACAATAAVIGGIAVLGAGIAWRGPMLEALRSLRAVLDGLGVAVSGFIGTLEPVVAWMARLVGRALGSLAVAGSWADDLGRAAVSATTLVLAVAVATTVVVVGRDLARNPAEEGKESRT